MFLRCTAPVQRDNEDITAYFAHEMTAVPTSLFRDFLRKLDKSELDREIKKNMRDIMSDYAAQLTPYSMLVIDGSSLLYFMRGMKSMVGMKSNQPNVTNTSRLERCQQQIIVIAENA